MTTYYVDPLATGNDDGTSTTDAWTSLQRAIDGADGVQPTAGDIVYCRAQDGSTADETLTVQIDFDGGTGIASSFMDFIGVNSNWINDGTKYVIDGNNTATNIFMFDNIHEYMCLENFKLLDATSYCINCSTNRCDNISFNNFWLNNSVSNGNGVNTTFLVAAFWNSIIEYCNVGCYYGSTYFYTCIFGNNTIGINGVYSAKCDNCLFYNNTTSGWETGGNASAGRASNCVFDNNGDGLVAEGAGDIVFPIYNCRFTNHTGVGKYGLKATNRIYYDNCYFQNNTNDVSTNAIDLNGHSVLNGSDVNYGYAAASGDYTTARGATLSNTEMTFSGNDSKLYMTAGLPVNKETPVTYFYVG